MKEKPCKICGKMFIPECASNVICHNDHYSKCPICGKEVLWNSTRAIEPCSKECKKEATKRKNIAKYGVEHPMQCKEVQQHHKASMIEKYGVESPLQSSTIKQKAIDSNRRKFGCDWALSNKDIKEKSKNTMIEKYGAATTLESDVLRKKVEATCLEKYGVSNVMQSINIRNKVTNTNFLKYSVANPMQVKEFQEKAFKSRIDHYGEFWPAEINEAAKCTFLSKYGYSNPSKSPEIQEKIKETMIEKYGSNYGSYLTRNASANVISNINKAFMNLLNEKGIDAEFEFTGISNYRYDISIPNKKILIEIDPTYTHNVIGNHWTDKGLSYDYHASKSKAAHDAGYQCIHVFDWDDWNKIIDMIADRKTIGARKCTIYKLQPKVADEFLTKYHIQGTVKGQVLCLGLVHEGDLLQVMTFGKPRYSKKHYSELLRLCTKPGISVAGGASKLFKFATNTMNLDEIVSYCDLAKFSGDVYTNIGMQYKNTTDPQEVWSKGDSRITANLLRQRGFDQIFGTNFGKGTSNEELMIDSGWLPVYDCGQAVYEYRSNDNKTAELRA